MRGVSNRAKWCPRFQDLKISLGSQGFQFMDFKISMGFLWISGFLWDFNLWISRFLWDLWDFYGIISVFYGNNRYFTKIIGINILLGISDLGFKQDFSICVQDFSLLRTPRANVNILARTVFSSYNCETFHVYDIQY